MRVLLALAGLSILAACSADRAGWARRGSFWKLHESPSLQVRRGSQYVDPKTGELVLHWVGARAPENEPELLACELAVFDDADGDRKPGRSEILLVRESSTPTRKVLFDDVRTRSKPGSKLRLRLDVRTAAETCEVVWDLDPD